MSPFELVFALFGLLLGLAIAEVLGGFARALRLRRSAKAVRIGWLTPLLGLFVILDLTSFWVVAYEARDQLRANYLTLIVVSAIVGTYYLAASLIFPDDPGEWPDFDDHYDRQNRFVILGLLGANLGSAAGQIALEIVSPTPDAAMGSDAADRPHLRKGAQGQCGDPRPARRNPVRIVGRRADGVRPGTGSSPTSCPANLKDRHRASFARYPSPRALMAISSE